MSAASLAHFRVDTDLMSAHGAPASLDASALEMMERLVAQTHAGSLAAQRGDVDSLTSLLQGRDAMIASLNEIGAILAASNVPFTSPAALAQATRAELLAQAAELQRANIHLMQAVTREAERLAEVISGVDRPDAIEFAYRTARPERMSNLDLMR